MGSTLEAKTTDDPYGLTRPVLDAQGQLIEFAGRGGAAESLLRRHVLRLVRFEGCHPTDAEAVDRREVAVRVLRHGRVGIWGGSVLPGSAASIAEIVARAEANAIAGPPAGTILASAGAVPRPASRPRLPEAGTLVSLGEAFLSKVRERRPCFHWSGMVSAACCIARVVHSAGLDAWSCSAEYRIRLRGRCPAGRSPVDRVIDVRAGGWEEAMDALLTRIDAEFPGSENVMTVPVDLPLTLGPTVVAALCLTLVRSDEEQSLPLDPRVSIIDDPGDWYRGCDDEGVPVVPVSLVAAGKRSVAWVTVGATSPPTGRAIRSAIDAPPILTALGLRWGAGGDTLPPRTVLLTELAGLSQQPDGSVQGMAPEGVVLCDGKPAHRCQGRVLRITATDAFGRRLSAVSKEQLATGRHRLPSITLG